MWDVFHSRDTTDLQMQYPMYYVHGAGVLNFVVVVSLLLFVHWRHN